MGAIGADKEVYVKRKEKQQLRCIDCHFLSARPDLISVELENKARADIRTGNFERFRQRTFHGFSCTLGIWREAGDAFEEDTMRRGQAAIMEVDRSNDCALVFWRYMPGVTFETAAELRERAATEASAAEDRKLTRRSLRVAVWALVVSTAVSIATEIVDRVWPKP